MTDSKYTLEVTVYYEGERIGSASQVLMDGMNGMTVTGNRLHQEPDGTINQLAFKGELYKREMEQPPQLSQRLNQTGAEDGE